MNPNPILHYKPLDFCNPDEKLLKEYPVLKQWQEDKHFLFFIESIKEKYSVFLFDLYYLEPEDFSRVKIYLIPNSILCFLERILETNKRYLIKEEKVALKRADSVFVVFKVWEKKFFILKENNECVFLLKNIFNNKVYKTKTFKTRQCPYLFRYESKVENGNYAEFFLMDLWEKYTYKFNISLANLDILATNPNERELLGALDLLNLNCVKLKGAVLYYKFIQFKDRIKDFVKEESQNINPKEEGFDEKYALENDSDKTRYKG